jgi:hypothetical protein
MTNVTTTTKRHSTKPNLTIADYRVIAVPMYCVYWRSAIGGIAGRKSNDEAALRRIVDAKNAEQRSLYDDPTLTVYEVRQRWGDTWVSTNHEAV